MARDEAEELLVQLVQHGDIAAFEKLLIRMYQPFRRYLTGMVGESMADDVLQETFLRIYRQLKYLREPGAFQSWAYRIATRIALVHLKREKRWRALQYEADVLQAVSVGSLHDDEFDPDLLSKIDQVSPASRAVLLLHYQQHRSLEETAAILDIPVGTAKSRLSYGVVQLRTFIREKERR